VQETHLAWALAEAVKPHLSAVERDDVFLTIGLVKRSQRFANGAQRGCMPMLGTTTSGTFVTSSRTLDSNPVQVRASIRVNGLPTTPKRGQLVALSSP
jgi:hypothetical protein